MTSLIKIPFAQSGDKTPVPNTDPSGGVNMTQGYPLGYSKDPATDPQAKRIERELFNGLMNLITTAINELQVNGVAPFITSSDNGGSPFAYGMGATVLYNGRLWTSLANNNTETPSTTALNWSLVPTFSDITSNIGNSVGQFRISNKLLIQWGVTVPSPTDGSFTVQYQVAFSNIPAVFLGCRQSPNPLHIQNNIVTDPSRTTMGFSGRNIIVTPTIPPGGNSVGITTQSGGTNGGFWLAIGA